MILTLAPPTAARATQLLAEQAEAPFSYPDVAATRAGRAPAGFELDHAAVTVGSGAATYHAATAALRAWRMFDLGWVRVLFPTRPIAAGELQAVTTRQLGLWTLCACRIVYVIEEPRSFGFAYGTLPEHVERGEEQFLVEWLADDTVRYSIRAFSRPNHPLAWCVLPYARLLQARFRRDSCAAMVSASR